MAAILDFRKSDFWALGPLGLPILNFHLGVKCGVKMLIDAEIMAQNRNPRWRPSTILDFRKSDFWESDFWALGPLGLPIFHLGVKFGAKCWSTLKLWPKIEIQDGGRPPSWIFENLIFLSTGTPWAADFPSRCKIWCKNVDRCRNYGLKSKSKLAAVRHLGFVTSPHRTTHKVHSLGHIGLSNFMLIRCIVLKIWRFEIFADLAWNAYSRPKNFGFWG